LDHTSIVSDIQNPFLHNNYYTTNFNASKIGGVYRLRRKSFIFESSLANTFLFEKIEDESTQSIGAYCQVCSESRSEFHVFASTLELGSRVGFAFDSDEGIFDFSLTAGAQLYVPYYSKLTYGEYYLKTYNYGQPIKITYNYLGDSDYNEPKIDESPFLIPNVKLMMGLTLAKKWSFSGAIGINVIPFDVSLGIRLRYFVWENRSKNVE